MAQKGYGQYCPLALAAELLCERWTLLVMSRLIDGCRRFNEIHRGVPKISPTLLKQRLEQLEHAGLCERVPLADGIQTADLVRRLELSVILVVGLRLGCINHALLSAEAIGAAGLPFAGWLANGICRNYAEKQATLDYLGNQIPAPYLGDIPWMARSDPERPGKAIMSDCLFSAQ